MAAERALRAFWPALAILMAALSPLMFGWQDELPMEAVWTFAVLTVLGFAIAVGWGARRFRWPSWDAAVGRVDASLPGRPISAIADQQASGVTDSASVAVWQAHQRRMAERTRTARAVQPDMNIASRDPYGLRYIALIFFVTGLLFGSLWRVGTVGEVVAGGGGQQLATGPVWEGWIEPPAYTGKPSLYLADIPPGPLSVPEGSAVTLRLYGDVGALTVAETVSGRTEDVGAASEAQQSFVVTQDGRLAIEGEGGAEWQIRVLADQPPEVELSGPVEVEATGEMAQPFRASDDYAVVTGRAVIALDPEQADRRHGLAIDPEAREPLVIDLPMPFTGDAAEFEERLIDDFSQHPFANLPVTMTLTVADDVGQEGATEPVEMILPGRRFFQPIARAVIEQRRDLLWNRENAERVTQILRAVAYEPEGFFPNETTYLRLNFTIRQLAAATEDGATLSDETRDEVAQALWDLAIQLEEGTLADARERLARAQERLEEAMRNGASDEEIAELMQELREAMNDYMRMLAENAPEGENQTDQPDMSENSMEITQDELQALMDRIQELMEEGRMAEAMELMEQLNQLMENLQVTQGEGQGGPGQQSMEDLSETLRDQQELSDEAFRDLQDQFNGRDPQQGQDGQPGQPQPGQSPGQAEQQGQQGQGQSPGDQPNSQQGQQDGQGAGGEGSLADRQQALRDELNRQRGNLPSLDGEAADQAGDALDRAEGAMDEAEEALRSDDLAGAIDRQGEAMDALREGMRALGEALAENRMQEPGQGMQQGNADGRLEPSRRDPLGREFGNQGQMGTEENLLQGQDVYRRAEELLQELRRRAGEQERPDQELQYLKRLLERF
ncbi:ATPase [Wenxinia marina]|uniref:TIGR02302 family protein n=2 Tax=Wenxinia TaxID=653686 RepID=A0A0D0QH08_9RHOB|nr:TIGR02302 family protein [Wenxinia marina]KIQ70328.1 hypothetical protein Wenmar_00703 [Wenxinia marina DSM 24838]GGL53994.1 ATPase [Wenxinia marina]